MRGLAPIVGMRDVVGPGPCGAWPRLFGYRSGAIRRLFSTASARPLTAREGCGPKTAPA